MLKLFEYFLDYIDSLQGAIKAVVFSGTEKYFTPFKTSVLKLTKHLKPVEVGV